MQEDLFDFQNVKAKARIELNNAVKTGKIERKTACEICGKRGSPVEAHHAEYFKPLSVVWVCKPCHRVCDILRALEAGERKRKEVFDWEALSRYGSEKN